MNKIVKETVRYREQNNVERKDMLQILLQLRNTGKINTDDDDGHVNAQLWSAQKTKGKQKYIYNIERKQRNKTKANELNALP